MIAAAQGVSLFVAENLILVPSGIVTHEVADEPETVAFSAIWSPSNQSRTLRNLLGLVGKLGSDVGQLSAEAT